MNNFFEKIAGTPKKIMLALFLLALCAHGVYYGITAMRLGNDVFWSGPEDVRAYTTLAEHLREYHDYRALDGVRPESWYTPGYPFILYTLRGIGLSWDAIVLVQILVSAILPVLLFLLLRRITSTSVAGVTAFFFAIAPSVTMISSFLYSEPWFLLFFFLHVYVVVRLYDEGSVWRSVALGVIAGVLLGMAIYIRTAATYVIIAELAMVPLMRLQLPWRRLGKVCVGLVVAGGVAAVCVSPWAIRNHRLFGTYSLAATNSAVMYFYGAINFTAYQHAPSKLLYLFGIEESMAYREFLEVPAMTQKYHYSGEGGLANEKDLNERTMHIVRERPVAFVFFHTVSGFGGVLFQESWRQVLRRAGAPVPTMGVRDAFTHMRDLRVSDVLWFAAGMLGTMTAIVLVALGAVGVWSIAMHRRERLLLLVVSVMFISYFSMIAGAAAYRERYRYPATPFIFVLAVEGVAYIALRKQRMPLIPSKQ